jgi:hypothetical protein
MNGFFWPLTFLGEFSCYVFNGSASNYAFFETFPIFIVQQQVCFAQITIFSNLSEAKRAQNGSKTKTFFYKCVL